MHVGITKPMGECENVTVTTASGRIHNLGSPDSRLFKLRVWLYKKKRGISNG